MKSISLLILALTCASMAQARPTYGKHGIVVSASDLASQAGVEILKAGGSAADGAVATAFVLSVTRPYYGSLGGGGLLLTKFKDGIAALDYREKAPEKATEDMFTHGASSELGGLAVGIPGNVKGLFELHKKYGKLPWSKDIEPAVKLALRGFMVTEEFARTTKESLKDFTSGGKKYFLNQNNPLEVGDTFKQPQLAKALKIIQVKGADGFYNGTVATDLVMSVQKNGGILDTADLLNYKSTWMKPLSAEIFGATIYTMPPPSSGGALILSELKMAQALKTNEHKPYGSEEFHLLAEIMSRAFFDRQYLADPKFATVPVGDIYSDARVEKWIKTISPKKKENFDPKEFELNSIKTNSKEGNNTTHYVVVDSQGNVVSATTTLNDNYGSRVVSEKYGIVMNNQMDDFTTQLGKPNLFGLIQGKANLVAPGKTPLSSMTPTIIEKNGHFWMAVGSPGGPKIINSVFQVVLRALTTKLNIDQLIQAPRIHHQYKPDSINVDEMLSPDTKENLVKKGHTLVEGSWARVYSVRVTPDGLYEGAFDSRGEGGAAAY
jgi:gamma-glutamyltranspeptidase/glutathione hydrolase